MVWTKDGTLKQPLAAGVIPQGWDEAPIDQSGAVQALIDNAVQVGQAWGYKVQLPPGVIYGSFKMRGNLVLEGSGWGTTLKAMPGQTAPVLDYETYQAYHVTVRDIRLDGNYVPGRIDGYADATCRVIHMDDMNASGDETVIQNFPFNAMGTAGPGDANLIEDGNNPISGVQYWTQKWNDSANRISNVFITNCGGDWAVYIGINQRGSWISDLFVHKSKLGSIKNVATDTQFHNIQCGASSYGIYVGGTNQQWTQCKSWYVGQNAGYNTANGASVDQRNNGWNIKMLNNTVGQLRMINCEGQDNVGYDLYLDTVSGFMIDSFFSGGTTIGGVFMHDALYGELDVHFGAADLTGDPKFFVFDGTGGLAPRNNRIKWTASADVLSASTPYTFQNGATQWGQDIETFDPAGNELQQNIGTGTVTPHSMRSAITITADTQIQLPDLGGTDQYMYGDELVIAITPVTNDRIVTWASGYSGMPTEEWLTAGNWYVFRFTYLGTGFFADTTQGDQHYIAGGRGFKNVRPDRIYSAAVPTALTTLYTAPADVTFSMLPLFYFYNPTAASITFTLKVNGITVYTAAVGTLGAGAKANPPPLRPGDTLQIQASATGCTAYSSVLEVRDPSWKLTYALQATANTTATMYTCPAGKRARGIYSANSYNPMWVATTSASNGLIQFTPSGGSEFTIGTVAPAANASTVMAPLTLELGPGDKLGARATVANASFWSLVQEY